MVDPQSIHIAENAGVPTPATGQLHHKETVQQPAQKRPGTETGLYQEKHCRLGLKETMDKMKEGFWTSGILQDRTVELFHCEYALSRASQVALVVKNPPADAGDIRVSGSILETWVRSLGREDPLEEGMAIHSSILAWQVPWTEGPGGLQSTGSQRVGHDQAHTHALSFKKRDEYAQRWFRDGRSAIVTAGPQGTGPGDRAVFSLASEGQAAVTRTFAASCHPEPRRQSPCQRLRGSCHRTAGATLLRAWAQEENQVTEDCLEPEDLMELALLGFKLAFFFPISPFSNRNVSPMLATPLYFGSTYYIVFCIVKHCVLEVTCLVSQVHSCWGILLQDAAQLKSHPCLDETEESL